MSTITLARSRCVNANCPAVHVSEESGTGYVVGAVVETVPLGMDVGPGEGVIVLPADVTAAAAAAYPLAGLAPFASWPGVSVDRVSGVGYVVGRWAVRPPVGVAAGPGEAVISIDQVFTAV